ncbi:MAG: hypothetical protein HY584_00865 [Candidatus Omnitrophica bacterium]|nr:hypothetical protein [Candidatus Omnitrophota bacterium]
MSEIKKMPTSDRKKLLKKLNQLGRVVVILQKDGHLRVYDVNQYMQHKVRMGEVIQGHKPWIKRQKSVLGPIGSRALGASDDLSRARIYEER